MNRPITVADLAALPDLYQTTGDADADRAAWLAARRAGLGASDVGNIVCPALGAPSFGGPWDVLASKLNADDGADSAAMTMGRHLEDGIAQAWAERHGLEIIPAKMIAHPDAPWAMCTPDRWVARGGRVIGLLEIKNTRDAGAWPDDGADVTRDNAPLRYALQVQWQRWIAEAVLGAPLEAWLGVLVFGHDLRSYPVPRDARLLSYAVDVCGRWWNDHMVERKPLPVDGSAQCWAQVAAGRGDARADLTQAQRALAIRYDAAKQRERAASDEAAEIRAQLGQLMAGVKSASDSDWSVTWSGGTKPRTSFDLKAFRESHPDLAAEFTRTKAPAVASLRITRRGE